jgi:hypothetical protein
MLPFTSTTFTLLSSSTGEDLTTGNDVLTYPDPATAPKVRGSKQPQSSSEDVSGKEQVITTYRVFLPGNVALKATDRLLADGLVLDVDGEPQRWPSPFGGIHHVEANTLIVTG